MTPDYPAAHSMDTTWFAVDGDGHIACFESGEAGAVPEVALNSAVVSEDFLSIRPSSHPAEIQLDAFGYFVPGPMGKKDRHQAVPSNDYPTLLFLRSDRLIRECLETGAALQLPSTEGVALYLKKISSELSRRLHEEGECVGCFWHHRHEEEPRPAIFYYSHLTDNWFAGPYGRQRVPVLPITIAEISSDLRRAVEQISFKHLCFAETPYLQPVELVPCSSWGAAYLDVSGRRVSPIPGKESEYRTEFGDFGDLPDGIVAEKPPESATENAPTEIARPMHPPSKPLWRLISAPWRLFKRKP